MGRRSTRRKGRKSRRKGGSYYYPYNASPTRFTEMSSPAITKSYRGGWWGDLRSNLLISPAMEYTRNTIDSVKSTMNQSMGAYPTVRSTVLSQPIN